MQPVFGHERPLSILSAAMRGGRVHHAWVFHGPQGVGKFTVARNMAQMLLCHSPAINERGDTAPCEKCQSCRLFAAPDAPHPDFHVIYKELAGLSDFSELRKKKQSNIPVDLLRETMLGGWVSERYIEPPVGMRPMMNHGKVFVLDEADLLEREGQNSLLKTLEEPPPNTFIFLITSQEDKLLPTIRSRCQRVPFSELDDAIVSRWLDSDPSGANLSPSQRDWVLRFARGSIGRAKLALGYRLDNWAQAITPLVESVARGKSDTKLGSTMAQLIEDYAAAWVKDHKGASKDAANKAGVRNMLGLVAELCRQRLRDAAAKSDSADPIAAEEAATPWLTGIDLIQEAERNLESNVNIGLLLDNLAIQWGVGKQVV